MTDTRKSRGEERSESTGPSRRTFLAAGATSVLGLGLGSVGIAGAEPSADEDIGALIEEMTLAEKVSRTHGAEDGPEGIAGYLQGIERLDVSGMGMADGPPGASLGEPTTDFPHPVASAATFEPDLVLEQGAAIARETKDGGVSVHLAPSMDVFRQPLHSRAGETYGEDPHLAAAMAAAYTGAVQSEGVIATLKHFVAYNQTRGTGGVEDYFSTSEHDVSVGERALREIYYPPFKAAVTEGDAGAVMPAYNRVNGTFCSENRKLLRDVLKGEWGFDGFVVSDWGGTHSTVDAAENGLDIEMPAAEYFGEALEEAVEDGELDESVVDGMVERGLRSQEAIGALSGERLGHDPVRGTDDHFDLAHRIAKEGTVLLENDGVLPLDDTEIDEVALIGWEPETFVNSVGGSDAVDPIRDVGPVEGIESVADVSVTTASPDESEPLAPDDGFTYAYYESDDRSGSPSETGTVSEIAFEGEAVSVEWEGRISPEESGAFEFVLTSQGESTLFVNGEAVVENLGGGFAGPKTERVATELSAGEEYTVRVETDGGAPVTVEWTRPSAIETVAEVAAGADVAIVLAKTDTSYGDDRKRFDLPGNQNAVIDAVSEATDETVVLLNTESPVAMPWLDSVSALMQLWFPGQEGGRAVADLLFGHANPSGKTPVTFAAAVEDYLPGAVATLPNEAEAYPGVDGTVYYDEGVFVGYRDFDERGVEPLFPFGHGESYTDFEYSDLRVDPGRLPRNGQVNAVLHVENTGDRAGKEVVQAYVRDEEASVERPPKELTAFEKVTLEPGQRCAVTLCIDADDLGYYDDESECWVTEPGAFELLVGSSSRDVRLSERFEVR
ncbi:glycoside hydrolase family 3 N-terminal domain-containing protein [Halalkalicoccus subterraneus]|uniref:glycoside hydrolase family 3 N-terminal domain-containing protein n=1 Tax=Halalkalicoccus subterraneus TaxID=2675002 RepID=UPI000EFCC1CB|nr:glycoside hydrolase family 3 N-terminal domain-containing protein [Halalkalicoccus subterraneus]